MKGLSNNQRDRLKTKDLSKNQRNRLKSKGLSKNQKISIWLSLAGLILIPLITFGLNIYINNFRINHGFVGSVSNVDRHVFHTDVTISFSNPGNRVRVISKIQVIGWFGAQQSSSNQSDGVNSWNFWVINPDSLSPSLPIMLNPGVPQPVFIRIPLDLSSFSQLEQGITPPEYIQVSGSNSEAHLDLFVPIFSGSCEPDQKSVYLALNILSPDENAVSTYSRLPLTVLCIHVDPPDQNRYNYHISTHFISGPINLLSDQYQTMPFFP